MMYAYGSCTGGMNWSAGLNTITLAPHNHTNTMEYVRGKVTESSTGYFGHRAKLMYIRIGFTASPDKVELLTS